MTDPRGASTDHEHVDVSMATSSLLVETDQELRPAILAIVFVWIDRKHHLATDTIEQRER